jgi:S-adenosyl methyltransferase
MLVAVLHFLQDSEDPYAIVAGLLEALPAGSFLVVSHATADHASAETRARVSAAIKHGGIYPRSRDEFGRLFAGLDLIEPGIVSVSDWRAEIEPELRLCPTETAAYGAVGRLP